MRTYQSHKRVKAAQIAEVVRFPGSRESTGAVKHLVLQDGTIFEPAPGMLTRYMPQPGDYLVEYEDGHRSISPKKAFEDSYTLAEEG